MSRVSQLTADGDWTFGQSKSNYIDGDEAIRQNIKTRLLSLTGDWLLDTDANIDWLTLLGSPGTESEIRREVARVTIGTENVVKITSLELIPDRRQRSLEIRLSVSTIFTRNLEVEVSVPNAST